MRVDTVETWVSGDPGVELLKEPIRYESVVAVVYRLGL